jgi:PAS domain S-box-containing protein
MGKLAIAELGCTAFFGQPAPSLQAPQDFIEKLPFAVYACDAEGRILWFNHRASELWAGEPKSGAEGEKSFASCKLYFNGREVAGEESPVAAVLRTGVPVREADARIERPDGSSVQVRICIEPVEEDGVIVGVINYFREAPVLEPLQERDQRLAATYEHAGIGIAEVDANGRCLRVNAQLAELLGYLSDELLGRSIFDPLLVVSAQADEAQFHRQVRGEIDRYTIEKCFKRRDGDHVWTSVTSVSVFDHEGRFAYAVRVQYDVTAQKRAEAALVRRAEEQAALYEFVEGLQHSKQMADVYDKAMAAILRALGCTRASILLYDNARVMRFVSAVGLSQTYRRAVEGHSPWAPDAKDAAPVCIEDVAASDLGDELKGVLRAEGIGALAFIPITAGERLLGKFMIYHDGPHGYDRSEIDLALTIARQLGFAIGRVRDEAARQQVERAAQHLVAIVESSHDAIVSKDLHGVIATWNQGAERLFGYKAEEVIGRPITIIIPPDRLSEEPAILARIRRGDRVDHFETVRRRKDGSLVDISLTISPVRDGEGRIVGASKIARDITERKEAEAKLKDSEHRLKEILAAIPAAIYTTDAQGRITYFNEKAVELAGRKPTLGTDEWCVTWKLYRPDGTPLPHDECPMAVALREGRPIRNVEAIAERPDGTRVPFIPYPTPQHDTRGNIVGAINMLVDISERKEAETQQRILFNELNHRVKNNMQTLQSLLSLAGRQTDSGEARRILAEAGRRVAAMAAAQQVLYTTPDATRFNAREFLEVLCQTARQTFSREVNVTCQAGDIELSNDTAMPLALILNELLTNAVKHGVQTRETSIVRVELSRRNGTCVLSVGDDGPGFDMQAVQQRSSGLQLVQGLVRQLRGKFHVETNPTRCVVQFS